MNDIIALGIGIFLGFMLGKTSPLMYVRALKELILEWRDEVFCKKKEVKKP